ncbi:MAG: CopD family protein [Bacteroidota bacterium]
MAYSYIKALHIIFIVTWFAGLFYIVRLFVYTVEAHAESEPKRSILLENLKLWSKLLWFGITWPSAVITLLLGSYFLHFYASNMPNWLWVKLGFVVFLYIYHLLCHRIYQQLQHDDVRYTSQQLRIWNEVATIILVAVVFLVVLKNTLSMVYGLVGLVAFTVILMVAIQIYKRTRSRSKNS